MRTLRIHSDGQMYIDRREWAEHYLPRVRFVNL